MARRDTGRDRYDRVTKGAVKADLFPAHIRAPGVALPGALADNIFGGTAEYVALRFRGREQVSTGM